MNVLWQLRGSVSCVAGVGRGAAAVREVRSAGGGARCADRHI